ncbi:DMT family transporter [Paracoccus sp. (in: a-proteobacteria)]|uniref:DMT family transporter n=1 Tax=Paracoccus sp. TaxID=267 RepID=UPI00289EB964|nr:DMT family transporter [Paracoccus sp. (in: a-proteobacteria)]
MGWIIATLIAAVAQTGRNAAQRHLTTQIGTMGATAVRFLFGLPFALIFLAALSLWVELPRPDLSVLGWAALGAMAQIGATALMLQTMNLRGFGVVTALIKTEPVTLAVIGAVLLAEPLGAARMAAITVATFGVVMMSGVNWRQGGWQPIAMGVAAGLLFGLSSIGFRGAILALPFGDYLTRASTVLAMSLIMQTGIVLGWLLMADRPALQGIRRHWRDSLGAGFLGAFASLFWFLGFAMTSAANVRTLALIEVPLAQLVSGRIFRQKTSGRQLAGMGLIVLGVAALIAVSARG